MAAYNIEEIKRLSNLLAANVRLKLEYSSFANKTKKLLLVEGSTDVMFISHIKTNIVDCVNADRIFNSNFVLSTSRSERVNSKNAIAQLIFAITKIPSPFILYPDDIDKWDIYGLVDLDCDELNSGIILSRLFVTDTHDLETLLMSTDKNLFDKIDNCSICKENIVQAYFVAFQLATVRELLGRYYDDKTFNLRVISCGSCKVDFAAFVYDYKISILKLIEYIVRNSKSDLSTNKVKQLIAEILNDKSIKKRFGQDGLWKHEISTFDCQNIPDFWTSVNGHDILQLIKYYDANANAVFHNMEETKLDRNFELAIIKKYDYSMLASTNLYSKMKSVGLVN